MWKQLPSAVVRQSKLFHWTLSCSSYLGKQGSHLCHSHADFFRARQKAAVGGDKKDEWVKFFSTNLSQNDQKEQRGVIVFGYLGFHSTVFKVVQ